jgi:hypothetical protein
VSDEEGVSIWMSYVRVSAETRQVTGIFTGEVIIIRLFKAKGSRHSRPHGHITRHFWGDSTSATV